ncbi:MAG: hypothetical protein ACI9Y1_003167 [Lentisphaeria bacterium]|jgi:hypothetical protein
MSATLILIVLGWSIICNGARKLRCMKANEMSFCKAFKTFVCDEMDTTSSTGVAMRQTDSVVKHISVAHK